MNAIDPPIGHALAEGDTTTKRRLLAAAVAAAAATVLVVAAILDPSPEGLGTHTQLGAPSCGWIVTMDLPCPTCGMTTAFANAAEGRWSAAWAAQPLGAVLAVVTAMTLLLSFYVTVTGAVVGPLLGRLWGRRVAWGLAAVVVLAWVYKILSYKGVLR